MTSMNLEHNHPPPSDLSQAYVNRLRDLTPQQKDYICSIADTGVGAESVLTCFRRRFPDGPPITAKDVENLKSPEARGGSQDAHNLLQKLMALQQEDERWFVRLVRPVMQCSAGGGAADSGRGLGRAGSATPIGRSAGGRLQTVAEGLGGLAVQRP